MQHLITGGSKPEAMEQMEDLREPLPQNAPEKPDTFRNARLMESILHADTTVGHTAETMESKTKYKFEKPEF